jgi:hypothetical protein
MAVIVIGAYFLIKNQLESKKQVIRPISSTQLLIEYEEKLQQLNVERAKLEARQEKNPLLFNETQTAAIIKLGEEINEMEQAIIDWRNNKDSDDWTKNYDLCKLIYDEAVKSLRSLSEDSQVNQ